jgi:hypothetical protein
MTSLRARRQRSRAPSAAGVLPGINAFASAWLAELRRRWPDASPFGLYPAFNATGRQNRQDTKPECGLPSRGADGAA